MKTSSLPRLALTPGEPAGIGPDIVLGSARHEAAAQIVVIGDPAVLEQRARRIGAAVELTAFDPAAPVTPHVPGQLCVLHQPLALPVEPGTPVTGNADCVLSAIKSAAEGCLDGQFDAMVTGPVSKSVIAGAGHAFSGHTEYIAGLCGKHVPVMMLANDFARVALVTTHLPLNQVAGRITRRRLRDVISVVAADLQAKFNIENPRLLVCGINPHAGEQGHLGNEEIEIVIPVADELRAEGLDLVGPVPADTAFTAASLEGVDAVVAMYHDQGLPVLKSHGFGKTVNITLGLPVIRTSVDHGTAFDLAGSGRADATSLVAAIDCAVDMVMRRRQSPSSLPDPSSLRKQEPGGARNNALGSCLRRDDEGVAQSLPPLTRGNDDGGD
ncbi:MAG: 4-hydroxythreonine-4-phosphate dehydrogenase PdxA [Gammaproteobacteria bacterium]|nr:4-hydroxythreonine-4-phosphate dehydrogenase PdxA [Gammaproteobacteria bacterium]